MINRYTLYEDRFNGRLPIKGAVFAGKTVDFRKNTPVKHAKIRAKCCLTLYSDAGSSVKRAIFGWRERMEGEDKTGTQRQSIPSLAHALEEARSRAKSQHGSSGSNADETHLHEGNKPPRRSGSLLDLAAPSSSAALPDRKIEIARLAVEVDAARRALSGKDVKADSAGQESIAEIRAMLEECLVAVHECREMVRALAARRDRNYF